MMAKQRTSSVYQRNAFAPGLLAAAVLFVAPLLMGGGWFTLVLFVAAIFAVIVGWFAIQARQWWWLPMFAAIAVISPVSILAITAMYGLEVLVAFIQAYVFTILTCVYLKDALHPHH